MTLSLCHHYLLPCMPVPMNLTVYIVTCIPLHCYTNFLLSYNISAMVNCVLAKSQMLFIWNHDKHSQSFFSGLCIHHSLYPFVSFWVFPVLFHSHTFYYLVWHWNGITEILGLEEMTQPVAYIISTRDQDVCSSLGPPHQLSKHFSSFFLIL